MTQRRSLFAPLRHRDFRLLWIGLVVSNVGTWMQFVATGYLIDRLTLSPVYLGVLAVTQAVPRLFLSVVGGALADRTNRLRVLYWTNLLQASSAVLLTILTATGEIRVWQLIAISGVNSLLNAFDGPTRQSLMPQLVEDREMLQAINLNSVAFNGAGVFGPSLGGIVIAVAGEVGCFALNAVSFLAVLIALSRMRPLPPRPATGARMSEDIAEAFRLLRSNRVLLLALISTATAGFFGRSYIRLMPTFARSVVNTDSAGLGLLQAAPGLGTLLSTLYLQRMQDRGLSSLLSSSAMIFGAAVILFAFSPTLAIAASFLVVVGLFQSTTQAASNTLVQTHVDPGMRGRAMGLYQMVAFSSMTLGTLPAGALAEIFGIPLALGVGGALTIVAALALAPRLRQIAS
ncbi:MAG: MFS transporter [Armatimonadetes bacterium]|nr:MFS transporter [Armatimonadota bacterium]